MFAAAAICWSVGITHILWIVKLRSLLVADTTTTFNIPSAAPNFRCELTASIVDFRNEYPTIRTRSPKRKSQTRRRASQGCEDAGSFGNTDWEACRDRSEATKEARVQTISQSPQGNERREKGLVGRQAKSNKGLIICLQMCADPDKQTGHIRPCKR